jgi:hypothetical protein
MEVMMKRYPGILFTIILLLVANDALLAGKKTEKNEIRKTLRFTGSGPKEVVVDNVNGSIEVVGYNGKNVELVAMHKISARNEDRLQRAKEEVQLDIDEDGNSIKLYVDGPFRKHDGSINHRGWRHYGYEVIYDIELKVPYETDFYLKTVNEGEIRIEDVTGAYEVENINGGIQMENVGGSGRVYALNGEVEITFSKNPEDSSYFGSLNGDINVSFQSGFTADVQIKTFNGEAYSDFPFTYLPTPIETGKRKRGKYVYKSNKGAMVRVGKGGPYVKFDAFNGDIYIREI